MNSRRVIVAGGGAAGVFAGLAAAEPGADVTLLEKTARFLDKVRISGGGRCNVTHACFEPREFATRYPRGERALLAPFQKFSARDTVDWFAARGVKLKTESDGRMFPTTNSSQTIIDCLMNVATKAGVKLRLNCGVESITKRADGGFELSLVNGEKISGDRLLLATGGCRAAAGQLAVSLGHTIEVPVPSLFTFQIESQWLRSLAGVAVAAEVSVPVAKLRERGPLLVTHWGLSGPAILKMAAGRAVVAQTGLQISAVHQLAAGFFAGKNCAGTGGAAQALGRKTDRQCAARAAVGAVVGGTGFGGGHCARDALVGADTGADARPHAANHAHGIFRDRQKFEQGRIRDVRRREAGRDQFQNDGEQGLSRIIFRGRTAGH